MKWPKVEKAFINNKIEKKGDMAVEIIEAVRKSKSEAKKSLKAEIILTIEKQKLQKLKTFLEDLKAVTNAKEIKEGPFKIEFV